MNDFEDRPEPIHPESTTPPVFYHSEKVMFWAAVSVLTGLSAAAIAMREQFAHISVGAVVFAWAFSVGALLFLRARGALEDRPEDDVRAFANGGLYFWLGATLGAIYFFGQEGFAWMVEYDLTDVDFQTGFTSISSVTSDTETKGLAGFVEKWVRLLTIMLGGGAVTNAVAGKVGLGDTKEPETI